MHLPSRRPRPVVVARADLPFRVDGTVEAVVVGGGIAGTCAAVVLAERGVRVTLLEAQPHLGGRLGAWRHRLPDDDSEVVVEHGFHGFFRQYYTWRAILRRLDPQLSFLRPLPSYPIISRHWPTEDFATLPRTPPFNLLALVARSPSFRLPDLRHMDGAAAAPLLAFDPVRTYRDHDGTTAAEFLDALRLPDRSRAMLFEVFAHSFFNLEQRYSAAEFIAMCHFYFLGNAEGLGMDCPHTDYLRSIWQPMAHYLQAHGVRIRTATAQRLEPGAAGWRVDVAGCPPLRARHVVLAVDPSALQVLVAASPGLAAAAPRFVAAVDALAPGEPYTVARLWLERDVRAERAEFTSVSREPTLDSVTLYHRLEDGAASWAARTGGAVVELHSYASPKGLDADAVTARMRTELAALWPETAGLRALHVDARSGHNTPGFAPGSYARRPGVVGDAHGVRLAGDWVRLPFASALMERAAVTGVLAANDVLAEEGVGPEPVWATAPRGLLARRPPR